MDGYTTTNRPTPKQALPAEVRSALLNGSNPTVNRIVDTLSPYNCRQITTSFRTGLQSDPRSSSSLEDTVDSAGRTYGGYFSALKRDKQATVNSKMDTGHTFDTRIQRISVSHPLVTFQTDYSGRRYTTSTPVLFAPSAQSIVNFPDPPSFSVTDYGVKAVNNTLPTNPVVNLTQALAELYSDGFPSISELNKLMDRADKLRQLAAHNLAYQFAWLPLLGDSQNLLEAVSKAGKLLEQYQRDSGGNIRRSYTFPTEVTNVRYPDRTGSLYMSTLPGPAFDQLLVGAVRGGPMSEELRTQRTIRFSGAYTYHLQSDNNHLNKLKAYEQRFNHLIGTRLTPSTLWELAPWSWLADWKFNVGDNIANAVALQNDGLVLRYGYLMVTTIQDHTFTLTGPKFKNGTQGPYRITFTQVSKQRYRATPYGFGLNPASFDLRKWSILGSLGLTLAPGKLP